MKFHDQLNAYMDRLDCSSKELAEKAGLSDATVSRYRSGKRMPEKNSKQLRGLAEGLAKLAREKGIEDMEFDSILEKLAVYCDIFHYEKLRQNFNFQA